jgi:hypothetical protein
VNALHKDGNDGDDDDDDDNNIMINKQFGPYQNHSGIS